MVGKGLSSRAAAHSSARWNISSTRARSDPPSSFRSEPAEKFSPSPRSTRTRTLSSLDTRCTSRDTVSHISELMAFIFSGRRNEITATPPATCKPTGLCPRTSAFLASARPLSACAEDPDDIAAAILPQMVLGRQARTSGRLPTSRLDMTFTPLSRMLNSPFGSVLRAGVRNSNPWGYDRVRPQLFHGPNHGRDVALFGRPRSDQQTPGDFDRGPPIACFSANSHRTLVQGVCQHRPPFPEDRTILHNQNCEG